MIDRIVDYHHKLLILRQIMSNKAQRFRRINTAANLVTVFVSSGLTFIGFSGIDRITKYVGWIIPVAQEKVEFVFNLLVLLLFIQVILYLVFRFSDRQAESERAIVSLTHLINEAEDYIDQDERGYAVDHRSVDLIRQKYDTIIQVLPPNTDKEFLAAKRDFAEKSTKSQALRLSAQEMFVADNQRRVVEALIRRSDSLMSILQAIRSVDDRLYLGGGLIRNAVWDFLHAYSRATPIDDVDVVYFDSNDAAKARDEALETRLHSAIPNLRWSVKNQARMNSINDDPPYANLEDAIGKWPETATALAVRLQPNGTLDFIAPYGFTDLLRLIVAPTPRFQPQTDRFEARIKRKEWLKTWPKLQVRHG